MRRHGNLEPRSGAVCLAGRCCGSASELAWICIPPRFTLAIPNPFLPCQTPASHRTIVREKLADIRCRSIFQDHLPSRIGSHRNRWSASLLLRRVQACYHES